MIAKYFSRIAKTTFLAGALLAALVLNFLPWKDLRLVPDFVALVLTFWCVRQPRLVGLGVGWRFAFQHELHFNTDFYYAPQMEIETSGGSSIQFEKSWSNNGERS